MCLAKAYRERDDERELLLEDVALLEIDGRTLRLATLFGEERELQGSVRAVDFQQGTVLVEQD
jgi:predicted RNA-binding protein